VTTPRRHSSAKKSSSTFFSKASHLPLTDRDSLLVAFELGKPPDAERKALGPFFSQHPRKITGCSASVRESQNRPFHLLQLHKVKTRTPASRPIEGLSVLRLENVSDKLHRTMARPFSVFAGSTVWALCIGGPLTSDATARQVPARPTASPSALTKLSTLNDACPVKTHTHYL